MATGGPSDLCDICNGRHRTSIAVKWCPECEEKLCKECHINHSLSKILRHHTVINIKDYRNIPDSILEIHNFCNQHDMKYSNFCPQHDKLCCPACTTAAGSHSKCETLLIQDVIKTAKTSTLLKSMEICLKSLTKNIEHILKDRKSNIRHLQDQQQMIEREIKQTKETILTKVDVLEREIMEYLNSRVKQNTKQLELEVAGLEKRLKKSEALLQSTTALMDFGSDLQTYVGSKTMETEIAREIKSLHDLVDSRSLKHLEIRFEKDSKDILTLKSDEMFGQIIEKVSSASFTISSELDKQAQNMSPLSALRIDDVKSFQISGKNIDVVSCSVIPPSRIVLADNHHSCVVILKENGEIEKEIHVSSKHLDVTMIDSNTMAVSCDKGVKIINIATGKTEKKIPAGKCRGVEYYSGSLICGVLGNGVVTVDLTTINITTIVEDTNYNDYLYCSFYRNKIYVSRFGSHTITCYSMHGDTLWEYNNNSVISHPLGIAVDNSSNVYVASSDNNSVVVLSPDGNKSRTLLTEEDGIYKPTALHYNRSNNRLIVANQQGKVFLVQM